MALLAKKQPVLQSGTPNDPIARYDTETQILENLRIEEARLAEHQRTLESMRAGRVVDRDTLETANAVNAAIVEAGGTPAKIDRGDADIYRKRDVIRRAIERQEAVVRGLVPKRAEEIYNRDFAAEHFRLRSEFAKSVLSLKESWDKLTVFVHGPMAAGGAVSDFRNVLLCNFSQCGQLPGVLRSMSAEAFKVCNRELL